MNKMLDVNTLEYYVAIERAEVLKHATAWMSLEHVMLTVRSQSKKRPYSL